MRHSESIIINRRPAAVWALVGNPQSWGTWIPDVTEVRIEGDGAPSVGTGLSYGWRGKRQDRTVAAFETERVIGLASSEKRYEFSETIELREVVEGTEVTITMGFEPRAWAGLLAAIFMLPIKGLMLRGRLMKELRALRAAVEAQAS